MTSEKMLNHCLMIAFHYPPCRTSSGYLRSHKLATYLPQSGWQPLILTACPEAYGDGSESLQAEEWVYRTWAFDARKTLSWKRKYLESLCLPDRWWSWLFTAVWRGARLARKHSIAVIWSTYPIPTALLVGRLLSSVLRKPWVVDLRDPMIDDVHPSGRLKRWLYRRIESMSVHQCDALVVTTPGARELYLQRYPALEDAKVHVIGNGYDEVDFADRVAGGGERDTASTLRFIHSGTLYPVERNPIPFLNALVRVKPLAERIPFTVIFRAPGDGAWLQGLIDDRDLGDLVGIEAAIGYREALAEMLDADGLLLFQAANCDAQIPAKAYEYLRSGNPVFALTSPAGDTASLLHAVGQEFIVDIDSEDEIAERLSEYIEAVSQGSIPPADPKMVQGFSRQQGAVDLAEIFNRL